MNTNYGLKELVKEFGALTFGAVIKSHRLGEDTTQVELAKKIGISKQSLNDLESGRVLPSISRAVLVARKLGLMEAMLVELAIQDQISRENLKLSVSVRSKVNYKKVS